MADVVERLRRATGGASDTALCAEAATEIETLRARLSQAGAGGGVVEATCNDGLQVRIAEYLPRKDGTRSDSVMIWVNDRDTSKGGYSIECVPRHVAPLILAALAPSPSAGEPRAWIANDPEGGPYLTWSAKAAASYPDPIALYATPPAPVQPTASVERLVNAVMDYAAVPMGHDASAASKAVDDAKAELLASLTAPTQGDGGLVETLTIRTCGPIAPMVEPFDDKWLGDGDSVHVLPTPSSPVSAPSPAGGVREADAYLQALLDYSSGFYGAAIEHGMKAGPAADAVQHIERAARNLHRLAALSSPATPQPISAPAVELLNQPWACRAWGDGSSPADLTNVVCPDCEVVIAADLPIDVATHIAGLHNAALSNRLPQMRHLKRGSTYDVIGEGEVQISDSTTYDGSLHGPGARLLFEGDKLVVYRAHADGKLWLRFPDEFNDPARFEKLL